MHVREDNVLNGIRQIELRHPHSKHVCLNDKQGLVDVRNWRCSSLNMLRAQVNDNAFCNVSHALGDYSNMDKQRRSGLCSLTGKPGW